MDEVVPSSLDWNDASSGHRAKPQRTQDFSVTHPDTGYHVQCHYSVTKMGGGSPRHRHNCEQIRYVLQGHLIYGRKKFGPGTFIYIPESVYYGPQTRDEETRTLAFQFQGPSRIQKFTDAEVNRGQDELCSQGVDFQNGIAHFPSGKKRDSVEALWEHLAGRPIEYGPPRYEDPVYIYSKAFPWRPTGREGVTIKHLGYFNECGPSVSLLRLDPGASLPRGNVGWLEMRLIVEGEVEYQGQTCATVSRFYHPPGISYDEVVSRSGATLFVFQIAVPEGDAPKR